MFFNSITIDNERFLYIIILKTKNNYKTICSFFKLIYLFTFSPVPSYNWTRIGAPLPRGSYLTNYNRVLVIPQVQVEDQGEYNCHVFNDRDSKEKSLTLTIQGD